MTDSLLNVATDRIESLSRTPLGWDLVRDRWLATNPRLRTYDAIWDLATERIEDAFIAVARIKSVGPNGVASYEDHRSVHLTGRERLDLARRLRGDHASDEPTQYGLAARPRRRGAPSPMSIILGEVSPPTKNGNIPLRFGQVERSGGWEQTHYVVLSPAERDLFAAWLMG